MLGADMARRQAEVFNEALAQARRGRLLTREVTAQTGMTPKTIKKYVGSGILKAERELVHGKWVWFFDAATVEAFSKVRDVLVPKNVQAGRLSKGGRKLASAPDGYITLIDVARKTGHSMDTMRRLAKASSVPLHRGPKSVLMVALADEQALIASLASAKPRPTRQKVFVQSKIVWTPEMDAQLGCESDSLLAGRWGVSETAVRMRRRALGKSSATAARGFAWTPETDAKLGVLPDRMVAEMLGATPAQVGRRRKALGLDASRARANWTLEAIQRLGVDIDAEVARDIGLSVAAVASMRRRLGIASVFKKDRVVAKKMTDSLISPEKMDACRTVVLQELARHGFGFSTVTDDQVINFALDFLLREKGPRSRGNDAGAPTSPRQSTAWTKAQR